MAVAFQADGHLVRQRADGHWYVKFGFRRERKIQRMMALLEESPYEWSKRVNGRGDTVFRVWLYKRPSKDFASWVVPTKASGWYVSFLDELAEWDGWRSETGIHYEASRDNCEVVQMAATLAGRIATVHAVKKLYRVNMWESALRSSKALRKGTVPYEGDVYCVRMPHGTVVTRRDGKICVTGNCHRVGADNFSQSAYKLPAKLRLGVSATPDRKDGKMEVIRAHIGPVLVAEHTAALTPRIIARRSTWSCPLIRKVDKATGKVTLVELPHSAGRLGQILSLITAYHERNLMIANFVGSAYRKGRMVLVQSDRREHLENLMSICGSYGVPPGDMAYYVGGMSEGEKELSKTKKVLFATYQMTSEGTNIPELDTLVMATPRSDVVQIVGRILREHPSKKDPVVFDVVDTSSVLNGYWKSRLRYYKEIGAEVQL